MGGERSSKPGAQHFGGVVPLCRARVFYFFAGKGLVARELRDLLLRKLRGGLSDAAFRDAKHGSWRYHGRCASAAGLSSCRYEASASVLSPDCTPTIPIRDRLSTSERTPKQPLSQQPLPTPLKRRSCSYPSFSTVPLRRVTPDVLISGVITVWIRGPVVIRSPFSLCLDRVHERRVVVGATHLFHLVQYCLHAPEDPLRDTR